MNDSENLKKIELKILSAFHQSIAREELNRPAQFDTNIPHVTSLVYDCVRKMYYDLVFQNERKIDLKGAIRTWIGRKLHTTRFLNGELELALCWDKYLQGVIDEYDYPILLDKKTVRAIPRLPRPHHVKQLEYYKLLLHKNNYRVDNLIGCLLYINVQSAEVKAYVFPLTKNLNDIEKEVIEKYTILQKSLQTGLLPPRVIQQWEYGSVSTVCDYCHHYGRCWSEDITLKK